LTGAIGHPRIALDFAAVTRRRAARSRYPAETTTIMGDHSLMPRVTLSIRATRWAGPPARVPAAIAAGLDGLDLHLGRRLRARSVPLVPGHGFAIDSVWAPPSSSEARADLDRLILHVNELGVASRGAALVLDGDKVLTQGDERRATIDATERLRRHVPTRTPLLVSLSAKRLEGGRDHLRHLTALRHLAEEWDLGVALDLTDPIDETWEAEAAITRLMPRLWLLRVGSLDERGRGFGRPTLTVRALAAAADCGFGGLIALAPSLPFWERWHSPALVRAYATVAERIRAQFAPINAPLAKELFPKTRPRL
jgi:hypothetical protein